jgi:hypothetical protein
MAMSLSETDVWPAWTYKLDIGPRLLREFNMFNTRSATMLIHLRLELNLVASVHAILWLWKLPQRLSLPQLDLFKDYRRQWSVHKVRSVTQTTHRVITDIIMHPIAIGPTSPATVYAWYSWVSQRHVNVWPGILHHWGISSNLTACEIIKTVRGPTLFASNLPKPRKIDALPAPY